MDTSQNVWAKIEVATKAIGAILVPVFLLLAGQRFNENQRIADGDRNRTQRDIEQNRYDEQKRVEDRRHQTELLRQMIGDLSSSDAARRLLTIEIAGIWAASDMLPPEIKPVLQRIASQGAGKEAAAAAVTLRAIPKPAPVSIRAADFVRGINVALASGPVAIYGADVLLNGPPYNERPNAAEFEFRTLASGSYRMSAEYAAESPRPVDIYINRRLVISRGLSAPTGCFEPGCQKWMSQGEVQLEYGLNILRIERDNVFPHVRAFKFEPVP